MCTEYNVLILSEPNDNRNEIARMLEQANSSRPTGAQSGRQHADDHSQFCVTIARSPDDVVEWIDAADVIIVDLSIPDNYLDCFIDIKDTHNIPVVVIAPDDDETTGIRAVKSGAQDCLMRGQFTAVTLRRSILYAVERCRREIAEGFLSSVLLAMKAMRHNVRGLAAGVRDCRMVVAGINQSSGQTSICQSANQSGINQAGGVPGEALHGRK